MCSSVVLFTAPLKAADEAQGLVEQLSNCQPSRCVEIRKELIRIGQPSVEPLIDKLKEPLLGSTKRELVYIALGEIRDSRAVGPLIDELKKKDVRSVWEIAIALGKINDQRALPVLKNKSYWGNSPGALQAAKAVFTIEESSKGNTLDYAEVEGAGIDDGAYVFTFHGKRRYLIEREGIVDEKWSPLELSLMPWYKIPSGRMNRVTGLSLGIKNLTASVYGAQLGVSNVVYGKVSLVQAGVINKIEGNLYGIQLGVFGNHVEEKLYGVQLCGLYNMNNGAGGYGFQGGLINLVEPELHGIQVGLVNAAAGKISGVQAGLGNWTSHLAGMQVGLINLVGYDNYGACYGLQVGLINWCGGTLKGVQLGLLNTANSAVLPWSIGVNAGF